MKNYWYQLAPTCVLALMLVGCKIDLYGELTEAEANQMLALLLLRNIDANKETAKDGLVKIKVEEGEFVNAVELLRQNGLPRKKAATIEDLFPSGQLVTSPVQEHAKLTYLKEQHLEKMLHAMDGVITAQVSIGEGLSQNPRETPKPTASAFIKYSPERNFLNRETEIRSLVFNSVPNLQAENISVVMQAADYRYQPLPAPAPLSKSNSAFWFWPTVVILVAIGALMMMILPLKWRRWKAR